MKWNKSNSYIKKHDKSISTYEFIVIFLMVLTILVPMIYGNSQITVNDSKIMHDEFNSHDGSIYINDSEGVIIGSDGAKVIINK